jgi:hypothetical protein
MKRLRRACLIAWLALLAVPAAVGAFNASPKPRLPS